MKHVLLLLSLIAIAIACQNTNEQKMNEATQLSISKAVFGNVPDGVADIYTLKNANGVEVAITNYGGIVVNILVPDKNGVFADVNLGYDSLSSYIEGNPYFGAIIGRYGNRIAKGKFVLDGTTYTLATNNGANHLHGGIKGFDKVLWAASELRDSFSVGLLLTYISKDMEEGYPGNLSVTVRYQLNNQNELSIQYEATTDKKTICNLTNHAYFNLAGAGNGDILRHQLMINAAHFTPVDSTLIPTGEIRPVAGTAMDFTTPTAIGARVEAKEEQIIFGRGYDHNFVLQRTGNGIELAATVHEPISGRYMEVYTTEPGVQFYCGNFLSGDNVGKNNKPYLFRYGFCLETQHFPNSPNQSEFPSVVLEPEQKYQTTTIYKFSTL